MNIFKNLARVAGLGLCVVALSGTALADPGNGNGNGPAVTPPGQEKKAEPAPAPAVTPAPAAAPENNGQAKKAENAKPKAVTPAAKPKAAKPAATPKAVKPAAKPAKAAPAPVNNGQAKKAEKQAAKAVKPASKPAKSGSFKNTSSGTNEDKPEQTHRHTICHATGSASNPYVRITPSLSGVFNGHMGHQDGEDIIPPATYKGQTISQNWDAEGQAIFNAGCTVPAPTSPVTVLAPEKKKEDEKKEECPTSQTTTERVIVGVWHATGAVKDGKRKYVYITPSLGSAHYDKSKHPDDIIEYAERTVTTPASTDACKQVLATTTPVTPPVTPIVPELPVPVVPTPPGQAKKAGTVGLLPVQQPVGGVAGAVSPAKVETKKAKKEQGGVLGAVASAPEAIARTATSGTLPFTGIPLWIAALIGGALLLAGVAVRRSA